MITKMKGTYDVTDDIGYLQEIEKKMLTVSKLFRYEEIRTPHFEATELFHRGVGETTDIINKETYTFEDRGNRQNTLRPEGTAGVVRAYIENKLYANPVTPQKYFYYGSMFRYERPQKGRFREFRQFGAEAFGSASPEIDAEVIAYAVTFLKAIKLKDVTVHLNSLGGKASKTAYHQALKAHLKDDITALCGDCQTRYKDNPLRILDCKVDADHPLVKDAPKPLDYLVEEDRTHFERVQAALKAMQIPFVVDDNLVRGLDYYTHTVFEIKVPEALLGRQNAICGGGRYNNLVETLGGPQTPATGFAFGIERIIVAMKAAGITPEASNLHVYFIALGDQAKLATLALMQRFRIGGLTANTDYLDKNIKGQFKQSDHQKARFVIVIGDAEIAKREIEIKDQRTGDTVNTSLEGAYETVVKLLTKGDACEDCDYQKGAR